jgi:hypothetical protein
MTNPREDLVDLLIGGSAAAARVIARMDGENGWPEIFHLAASWSVVPSLRTRLADLGISLSENLKQQLFGLFQEAYAASTLQARRGVSVCRKLQENAVPVVIFKGLAAIAHLYQGQPSARTIKDVDIVVSEKDLDGALNFLDSLGLKADHGGDLRAYTAFLRNSPGFAGNKALSVGGTGLGELDVHWSLGPNTAPDFRVEAIIERSCWVNLFEQPVRVISPCDGLLLTAHHAVREDFAPDGMLRDVLDASAWLSLLEHRNEMEECLERARRCRIEDPVLALMEILAAKEGAARRSARSSRRAAALSKLFWFQTQNGPLGKDITYLADPYSLWQIARGALSGWSGYTEYMKAFEVKLTGKPISLKARVTHLGRHLSHQGFGVWRMIRLLAKTKAAYQRGI